MNSVSSDRVVVFSKSADAQKVKTRMRPLLTPNECLSLHLSLLQDTLTKVRDFSTVLYLSGSSDLPFDPGIPIRFQSGMDLGARMKNAFQAEFQRHSKIVIIGTDSPTFPVEQLSRAFAALDQKEVVLGPCDDGGYYLVGLHRLIPEMFSEVPWGTRDVLKKTLEKISPHSSLLLDSYFDVDLPEDLMKLKKIVTQETRPRGSTADPYVTHGDHLKHTRNWISNYFNNSAR